MHPSLQCQMELHGLLENYYSKFYDVDHYYRYASARAQPPIDDSQDIMNYTASLVGGRQMISFVRAIDTGDSDDLSLNQCVYFLWAYGGPITGVGPPAVIGQHTARGVFNEQVCLNMCEESKLIYIHTNIQTYTHTHTYIHTYMHTHMNGF